MPNPLEEAQLLIDTFAQRNGGDESNLCDLLADLMLWAEQNGRSFGDELTRALNTWLAESPQVNDAVLRAWATQGHPFAAPQPNTDCTAVKLVVDEWFQTGELSSALHRVGVTSSEILAEMGRLLDRADACEIPGDVLFRATDGKLYTVHVDAEIVEVALDDDWALETIAAADGELVDERDCLNNPDGEGEVCSKCLDKRDEAERPQIIAAARAQYAQEGSVEIDDQAAFSRGEEAGVYVAAWVWLPWPVKAQS